jgi:hypothetical protein
MSDINGDDKTEEVGQTEVEEIFSNLEIYIECLQENVSKFKNTHKPGYFGTQEFILEYVNLEEKILDIFDSLNTRKIDKKCRKQLENLVNEFNASWTDYQDTWTDVMWEIYENTKKKDKKINIMSYLEEENRYIVEVKLMFIK